jgi:hypothetical protein
MQSQDEFNSLCLIVCSIFRRDEMHRVSTSEIIISFIFSYVFSCRGVAFVSHPKLRYGSLFVVWIWNLRFEGRVVWLDCLKNLIFVS